MSLPMALGLYSVRDLYKEDFDACLRKVADIGYTGVECFGEPALPAQQVVQALQKYALALVGWHLPIQALEGDALEKTVAYLHAVGCARAIVPHIDPAVFEDRERILALANRMNAIQKALAPHGIALGYHNHAAEFRPLEDGTLPWAVLMDHTNIIGQLDTGNAMASETPGINPAELVACWPGRANTIHLKPYSYTDGYATMIGEDDTDWSALVYAAEHTGGAKWLIVEYEDEKYEQFEGVALCIHAMEQYN